jgi:hypothetical protein
LRHTFVPRIRYLGFTTRGKKGPLTTTGDLSACKSKRTLIQLLTVNGCVAIFMDRYTFRGENGVNVTHEPGTTASPGTAGPAGAAGPAPCHILSPEHFLPRVHNLDERDLSRKCRFDRMDEVVITWINGSTSPADQRPQLSFQEHPKHHQVKAVHSTA